MTKREPTAEERQELLTNRFTAPFKGETIGHVEVSEEKQGNLLKRKIKNFLNI